MKYVSKVEPEPRNQLEILAKAFLTSFAIVAMIFFATVLLRAPSFGVLRVTVGMIAGHKYLFFGLGILIWFFLNFQRKR